MALDVGSRLGPYEIAAKIGEGGMGEVYQARDTKLDRDVALKVLPQAFTEDPDRLARFEREAKVLASLNHTNIGHIYGIEEAEGTKALVLELVEGPTLADRIAKRPIPLDEALPIAKQIAEALEAAHEAGVIHRDLKPANIKVRDDGTVKVLDFGLAKALDPTPEGDPSQSPTLTAAATQMGVIMGTAAYMSPEQARGKPVDKRADIWAFGCVLYEMLTGKRAFQGEDVSLTLASVMKSDLNVKTLPADLPSSVRTVIHRCLEKDPSQRMRDIGDVRLAMLGKFEAGGEPAATAIAVSRQAAWPQALPWVAGIVLAIGTGVTVWSLTSGVSVGPRVRRSSITLPEGVSVGASNHNLIALSPQGTHLAYVGNGQLYLRAMDQTEATPIQRTQGAIEPAFSPDGQWIAFWADGQLKKVPVTGGAPVALCDAAEPYGTSWTVNDSIFFNEFGVGLWRVPGTGGTPELIVPSDEQAGGFVRPQLLPGGDWVLFSAFPSREIMVHSLTTSERRMLIEDGGGDVRYLNTGHLAFVLDGSLFAVAFDADRKTIQGGSVPLLDGINQGATGTAQLAHADDGTLIYLPGRTTTTSTLGWVNREGELTTRLTDGWNLTFPRLSPDGTRAAFAVQGESGWGNLLVRDLATGRETRLTETVNAVNQYPVWTPDGATVIFTSVRGLGPQLYQRPVDLSQEAESLLPTPIVAGSWTPDGQTLVYYEVDAEGDRDIWRWSVGGDPVAFLATELNEFAPRLSPDGRWLAYVSDQAGENRVFVQAFPEGGSVYPVSTGPGVEAVWSPDGQELFYRDAGQMWVIAVETGDEFVAGAPELLFEGAYLLDDYGNPSYDVSHDGQQFLMVQTTAADDSEGFVVVQDWFEELKERVPVD